MNEKQKIYINDDNNKNGWICNRLKKEWIENNTQYQVVNKIEEADIVWIFFNWLYRHLRKTNFKGKKVITTIHHIVKRKFKAEYEDRINFLNKITDQYHVFNQETKEVLEKYTNKPIIIRNYWSNPKLFYPIKTKLKLKNKYKLPEDKYLIGSFQKDSERNSNKPKLEKGPDIFINIVLEMKKKKYPNLEIVLTGHSRKYIIEQLQKHKIKYYYFERVSDQQLNELYNILDLYIVSSRCEGGPQAIIECALAKVPIISSKVGIADKFLDIKSIYNNVEEAIKVKPNIEYAYQKAIEKSIKNEKYMENFNKIFNI